MMEEILHVINTKNKGGNEMKKNYSLLLILTLVFGLFIVSQGAFAKKDTEILKIAIQAEPSKLNIVTAQDTYTSYLFSNICDPLIEINLNGEYTSEDAVTESYSVEDDGKVYIFKIKKGIKFHNGEDLTAEDVKFTYEAYMDETLGSPHHKYYKDIEKLELLDDYTLKVVLSKVNVTFLTTARLRGAVLPKDYIEKVGWDGYERNPIGSGPYKFVKAVPGQKIILEKFEDYWEEEAKIAKVEFRFYPETTSSIMALQAKQIDFVAEMPADKFKNLKKINNSGLKFGTFQAFQDDRICFNKREDSIFSDVRLRQAVAYAIDRSELIVLTRGDMAVPAVGRIPNFHPATAKDANAYELNLNKAKELMAEAGYPDGFKTQLFVPSGYKERVLEAQQIQQQVAMIGIDLEVVALEWGTYLDVTAEGGAPMFRERWSASLPSPFSFVEVWQSESSWNPIFGTYSNEEVDMLIEKIKATADETERWKLYQKVQEIAMDDVASYPLYWSIVGEAYNDELTIPEELWNTFKQPIYHIDKWSF